MFCRPYIVIDTVQSNLMASITPFRLANLSYRVLNINAITVGIRCCTVSMLRAPSMTVEFAWEQSMEVMEGNEKGDVTDLRSQTTRSQYVRANARLAALLPCI